jgi:hypothetical protein
MKPKEKAKALFDKMYKADDVNSNYPMCFDSAKQCALIAVDEILSNDGWSSSLKEWNIFKNYFEDVKQEIKKL